MQTPEHTPECEVKFAPLNLKQVDENGTFEGYASLFDRQDLGRDVIMAGAFAESLKKRTTAGIKMLFQHDASEPVGIWNTLLEDTHGLFARGTLLPGVARAREILSLMKAGALDGLSIGFKTIKASRDKKTNIRHLHKIDLWEISIVTFPMQPEARISSVKSRPFASGFPSEREFERWLVRDAGFSRSQARIVINSGLKSLAATQDAVGNSTTERLLSSIKQAIRTMQP
jgi:HK97 family phage prohead protease